MTVSKARGKIIETAEDAMTADKFATGDYYCVFAGEKRAKIVANSENSIEIFENFAKKPTEGDTIMIQIRLQRPYIDIEKCIGCGVCEHECPVSGRKAIRVSAECETRSTDRALLLKG